MSVFPGLCGDVATTNYRVFLGTLPNLAVEERFLRQVQPVFPWYASRKHVKEQASEFLEIDLASCDPELLLRYTHVYYVRRQLYDELVDRQLTLMETGKAAKVADSALLTCLAQVNAAITPRLQYELHLLQQAKKACRVPRRRELNPDAALEAHDYLCMMRVVEEDVGGIPDAEMQARAYLPREVLEAKVKELAAMIFGDGGSATKGTGAALERKEQKLLQRMIPADYNKVGAVEKLRPVDVTALYRFTGERVCGRPADKPFARALWGHVFRKVGSHPLYLQRASLYWARHSGLDPQSATSAMPADLATAVCVQQALFPALKYRCQYLYTSPDIARQQWRTGHVVPLLRLFPLLGAPAAEDLAAQLVVEGEWAKLGIEADTNLLHDTVLRQLKDMVEQVSALYESDAGAVLKRVEDGAKVLCPSLSERESLTMRGAPEDTSREVSAAAAARVANAAPA
ncbi:conserved hypothetical protein [Leishmania major strain Friedlin]|uniref:Uncharacterized protein n=1 Tax=Leishmania major TaxID=5664 RepID=Q4Q703_LEIMA|nr:conserved hypothetical protein [Leishmania major strain Friedlin]7AIH_BM Chain BM, mL70 [Leishmania major]7AM2_BM Chain BM, mL70 [Leishmania tarentolae]7ANE_BM Chain BM, mL70 [Leishmania major]CAG9578526.1 mitoribosomal_protein_mL70 [Leishmania major strain Friedlin]CAJ06656.1 conserved hypothetical protein [Leishmania major strain Friedlin]|eukprot:XP_001684895.1 conserved hypothetical protein [Leishmania major strain Friedlin]